MLNFNMKNDLFHLFSKKEKTSFEILSRDDCKGKYYKMTYFSIKQILNDIVMKTIEDS